MILFRKKRIYLDFAAATPLLRQVEQAMRKYWGETFYNPSSIYREGADVRADIDRCRAALAQPLGVSKSDIIFTAGGTESANLAILGAFEAAREEIAKPHIIISAIEHSSVVEAALEVRRRGGRVSVVPVDAEGRVRVQDVLNLVKPSTFLVSVMLASNEIGTIEPVAKIGRLLRASRKKRQSRYPYLHSDASQAPNYLEINAENLAVDLLTLDGAKIYGPKGSGILVVRPWVSIRPSILGGGQEGGLRAGTENAALIVGFTTAFLAVQKLRATESDRVSKLRKVFMDKVQKLLPQTETNTPETDSLPNIISISVPNIIGELMVLALEKEGVLASSGSACSTVSNESGSDVIRAIGKRELAENTVRFSLGQTTTVKDVEIAAEKFAKIVNSLVYKA